MEISEDIQRQLDREMIKDSLKKVKDSLYTLGLLKIGYRVKRKEAKTEKEKVFYTEYIDAVNKIIKDLEAGKERILKDLNNDILNLGENKDERTSK